MMITVLAFAGVISGITTVLFGFGGGFITVPLLAALLTAHPLSGVPQGSSTLQIAVATSAAVMLFSSLVASLRQLAVIRQSAGGLWLLGLMIAVGGIAGAVAAQYADGKWIRAGFVVYLLLTLLDCLFRPGFLHTTTETGRPRPLKYTALCGLVIGAIAAFLGVGGSVMTVPLMRRRGASMHRAAALANPLTLPMALTATLTYALASHEHPVASVAGYLGYINIRAALVLMAGSTAGMWLAARLVRKVPDKLHARLYPWLLGLVLILMLLLPVSR